MKLFKKIMLSRGQHYKKDIPKITKESHVALRQLINVTENHIQCLKALGQPITENHIQCLKALGQPTDKWDAIIVPIIAGKLDFLTNKEWEQKVNTETESYEQMPTITEFLEFLNNKQNTLEVVSKRRTDSDSKFVNTKHTRTFTALNQQSDNTKQASIETSDTVTTCSAGLRETKSQVLLSTAMVHVQNAQGTVTTCSAGLRETKSQVLLSTAMVHVQNAQGHVNEEEAYCEAYFNKTTQRTEEGNFMVKIPFKEDPNKLGNSRQIAQTRFYHLEAQLKKDANLKEMYVDFMNEYEHLNHMTKLESSPENAIFLPHHGVLKETSDTTKLRVVFDGSCKFNKGLSLNDVQLTGPTIQDELFALLARFRTYAFVVTADVEKMYRQVWIHETDRKYQQILWRENPNQELQCYQLNTVTYGTTSAPYLAIRSLYQLGLDYQEIYPREANIIKHDFYVDDLLTGANTEEELLSIKNIVESILETANFKLRKWTSNVKEIGNENRKEEIAVNEQLRKTLGIGWNPNADEFFYNIKDINTTFKVTKRTILATTAELFDPLGLLAPTTVIAKFILQELWQLKLDWDESVPLDLHTKWLSYRNRLKQLNEIKIPRYVILRNSTKIEMHTFSDASEKGYGACIYLKSYSEEKIHISLLAAKTRVAPLKHVTLPRLELCAAVIAAQLANKFKNILNIPIHKEYYWCDSQITLHWIQSSENKWKTYVANRVSEIQQLTNHNDWHYVISCDNAADLLTRGILPNQLLTLHLWWNGPNWLSNREIEFPHQTLTTINPDLLEIRASEKHLSQNHLVTMEERWLQFSDPEIQEQMMMWKHHRCPKAKYV
ncbi:Protein of unknown function (DUF1759) [Popillia japonica]|uniref:Reverse transcriptase domain-containing protein n=1 Tax=Popillia japonica TaxID=7064 RepID=A0AAW1HFW8_POPJA